MGPLRLFLRGLGRMIVRRAVSRSLSRVAVRGVRSRSGFSRTMREAVDTEDLADEIGSQLDVLEVLELGAELPSIMNDARAAASAEGESVFASQMEVYNRGQQSLAQNYCMPYTEEYWQTTDEPDLDEYLNGLYSQHEAIEQALSDSAQMSFETARSAGLMVLGQAMAAYVAEAVISRALDVSGARMSHWNSAAWENFAADLAYEQTAARHMLRTGDIPEHLRLRVMPNGRIDTMVIADKAGDMYGATRQLSWSQFMGSDQPYWFTEQRALLYGKLSGEITDAQYESMHADLYRKTYRDPWSTTAPPGYSGYRGPRWAGDTRVAPVRYRPSGFSL